MSVIRLSLSEIKSRAIAFANEWKEVTDEDAEGKSFLDAFFNVFNISRKRVASFEKRVKKINGRDGYIDLLWKGNLLIEQKSTGQNLDKAYRQAIEYFPGLADDELPSHLGDNQTKIINESYYIPANFMVRIMNALMMKKKMGEIQGKILSNIKAIAEK